MHANRGTQALCILFFAACPEQQETGYASDKSSLKRIVLCFNVSPQFFLNFIPRMGERDDARREKICFPLSEALVITFG